MWSGSSASWMNLQPSIASNLTSGAFGTDGLQQVGNVRNSVTKSERRLGPDGRLAGNDDRPWFLVLENRYP